MKGRQEIKKLGGLLAATGLVLILAATCVGYRQYGISRSWPMVRALIASSRVVAQQGKNDENFYRVDIEFQYALQGKNYTTPATLGYTSSNKREMQLQAGYYAPGSYQTIRYNPSNPVDIRLTGSDNVGFFFLPAVLGVGGLGLAFFGTLLAVVFGTAKKHACEACGSDVLPEDGYCPVCGEPYHTY
jgi:hypothetical protein